MLSWFNQNYWVLHMDTIFWIQGFMIWISILYRKEITLPYLLRPDYSKHTIEPPHQKTNNLHDAKTKTETSLAVTEKLIVAIVFSTQIVQSLFFLNPKSQAFSLLLWLYRLVCVRPGRKPKLLVFLCKGSISIIPCSWLFAWRWSKTACKSKKELLTFNTLKEHFI